MKKFYYAYVAANRQRTRLWTGVTNDIVRKMAEHKTGKVSGPPQQYGISDLLAVEKFERPDHAIFRFREMDEWVRSGKIRMIQIFNPTLRDLTREVAEVAA